MVYDGSGSAIDSNTLTLTIDGTASVAFRLVISPAAGDSATPTFTTNLDAEKSVTVGETLTLTVAADASDSGTLSYAWTKGGVGIGTDSNTLTIANAQVSDSGSYKVVVTNTKDALRPATAESETCIVTVTEPNTLTSLTFNPVKLTLEEGKTSTWQKDMTTELAPNSYFLTIEPVAAANTKLLWTSSDKYFADVDEDGVITAGKPGVALISVRGEGTMVYAHIEVTVVAKPDPEAPEEKTVGITAPAGTVYRDGRIIAQLYKEDGTFGDPASRGSIQLTATKTDGVTPIPANWTSSDPKVAKVNKTSGLVEFVDTGTITLTVKGTTGDERNKTQAIILTIEDVTPKLPVSAITVYNGSVDGTEFTVLPSDSFLAENFDMLRVESVAKWPATTDVPFTVVKSGDTSYNLKTIAGSSVKGKQTVYLVATKNGKDVSVKFPITVTVATNVPKATVKMPTALNFYWKTDRVPLTTTVKDAEITNIVLDGDIAQNFNVDKDADGNWYIELTTGNDGAFTKTIGTTANPVVKGGKIGFMYKGWPGENKKDFADADYDVAFTVNAKSIAPKLAITPATQTKYAAAVPADLEASFTIIGCDRDIAGIEPKNIAANDPVKEANGGSATATPGSKRVNLTLKGAKASNGLQLDVTFDGARKASPAVTVKPTVKVSNKQSSFKLAPAALTFLTGGLTANQTQTVNVLPAFADIELTDANVRITPPPTNAPDTNDLELTKSTDGTINVIAKKPGLTGRYIYTVNIIGKTEIAETTTMKLTVNLNPKPLTATLPVQKGTGIDLVNRDKPLVYLPKIPNNDVPITDGVIFISTAPGNAAADTAAARANALFNVKVAGDNIEVRAKSSDDLAKLGAADFNKGEKFKVKLRIPLENSTNTVESSVVTITATQSAVKHANIKPQTMFQSRTQKDKHVFVDMNATAPQGAKIKDIKFKDEKWDKGGTIDSHKISKYVNNPGNAYAIEFDEENQLLHIYIKDSARFVKTPVKQNLVFSVIYEGQGLETKDFKDVNGNKIDKGNVKAFDIKVSVNILK